MLSISLTASTLPEKVSKKSCPRAFINALLLYMTSHKILYKQLKYQRFPYILSSSTEKLSCDSELSRKEWEQEAILGFLWYPSWSTCRSSVSCKTHKNILQYSHVQSSNRIQMCHTNHPVPIQPAIPKSLPIREGHPRPGLGIPNIVYLRSLQTPSSLQHHGTLVNLPVQLPSGISFQATGAHPIMVSPSEPRPSPFFCSRAGDGGSFQKFEARGFFLAGPTRAVNKVYTIIISIDAEEYGHRLRQPVHA